jgi:hypothetical protein
MDKPLSFSGYKRYVTCPQYYYYNDIQKISPGRKTSALIFGSLIDDIVNDKLLGKQDDMLENLFIRMDEIVNSGEDIDFYPDDFDKDLIDIAALEKSARELGWAGDDIVSAVKDFLKNQDTLSKAQTALVKQACWASLQVKADAMLLSFEKWILPHIEETYDVQKHLEYDNNGKPIHGYLDFTCKLKDGRKVLFDLKTSKMSYAPDSVLKSPQLALYAKIMDYEYAGFIVLCKTLNKNKVKTCPKCGHSITGTNISKCNARTNNERCNTTWEVVQSPTSFSQMIVDKVPDINKDLIIKAMTDTIKCIDDKSFPRNLNQCFYMYGKPCPYVKKCWKGDK